MRYLVMLCIGVFTLSACTKNEVGSPVFEVSFDKSKTYKEGDTVVFNITGNAENFSFYPGSSGFNYAYKDRIQLDGTPVLNFSTLLNYAGQVNTIKLWASVDFNGKYTESDVKAATWKELNASYATAATERPSGEIDLTEFLNPENKPLYLAFQYLGYFHATLRQPKWTIRSFKIDNKVTDGSIIPVVSTAEIGWSQLDFKNNTTVWSLPATGLISIDGTTVPASGIKTKDDNDDWAISKPIDLRKTKPDQSIPVKHLLSGNLDSYKYVYTKAGTYKGVFVAFNQNIDSREEVIKEFTITINPK
ncbi:DUF5017 domain-containing protein [Desertivirga xinjiangensis]|uniref:DUF5017 domain-containing protein n=1 Tax=Desertivirga xinjiangensis TaxID=539206 RepID=UPI00210DC2BE|nr:DUF5017 domain-containing protein [Pedobacter xinjiangensis]